MIKCDFCNYEIERGTGKMYVKNDGKIFHFCSSKCEKNQLKLGRKPRKTKWTNEFRIVKKGKA
ncbi:MAG: 50S ribosomal protein L24e [Candidatus Woesearchaeota archaeon]|jgi:large subunit ribosomal protein L24e